jgi:hypothetical protein
MRYELVEINSDKTNRTKNEILTKEAAETEATAWTEAEALAEEGGWTAATASIETLAAGGSTAVVLSCFLGERGERLITG